MRAAATAGGDIVPRGPEREFFQAVRLTCLIGCMIVACALTSSTCFPPLRAAPCHSLRLCVLRPHPARLPRVAWLPAGDKPYLPCRPLLQVSGTLEAPWEIGRAQAAVVNLVYDGAFDGCRHALLRGMCVAACVPATAPSCRGTCVCVNRCLCHAVCWMWGAALETTAYT